MLQSADLVHADEVPVEGTTSGDIDLDHFGAFFEKQYGEPLDNMLDKAGISLGQLLNNLGLAREATLNLAGVMLFGRNPQRHRPAFVIKAVSFVGNDPAGDKYRDSQDIEGCLRDLYKGTISFLTRNLRRLKTKKVSIRKAIWKCRWLPWKNLSSTCCCIGTISSLRHGGS